MGFKETMLKGIEQMEKEGVHQGLLVDRVADAILTDTTTTPEDASNSLGNYYTTCSRKHQKVIDQAFIKLSGWSLHHLIYDQEICDPDYRIQCRCV